jgi:HAD superfamily hydrolase (TIGR01484 family)
VYPDHHLLASDLDGTLIPPSLREGNGGIEAFAQAVDGRPDLLLAYVTGRHKALALRGIGGFGLPVPHVLVCDVGTSVFHRSDAEYEPDPAYQELMAARLGGADRRELQRRLAHPRLRLQEDEKQAQYKLSYYTPGGAEGEALARWAEALLEDAVGGANVVYSQDPETGEGLLDVLPRGVAKDVAVRYLHDKLGVDEDRLVYAGDSGNDRAAMLTGFNVVVVANASSTLKESIWEEAVNLGIDSRIYFALAPYAHGVLEGCQHFGIV